MAGNQLFDFHFFYNIKFVRFGVYLFNNSYLSAKVKMNSVHIHITH